MSDISSKLSSKYSKTNFDTQKPSSNIPYFSQNFVDKTFMDLISKDSSSSKQNTMINIANHKVPKRNNRRNEENKSYKTEKNQGGFNKCKTVRNLKVNESHIEFNDDSKKCKGNVAYRRVRKFIDASGFKSTLNENVPKNYNLSRNTALAKRVHDCFGTNPIEILNKKQTEEMNEKQRKKVENKTRAVSDYLGSQKFGHTINVYNFKRSDYVDKVVNFDEKRLKMSVLERRRSEAVFTRKVFPRCLKGKQVVYV